MKCQFCREEISAVASICPHCRTNFDEYYASSGWNEIITIDLVRVIIWSVIFFIGFFLCGDFISGFLYDILPGSMKGASGDIVLFGGVVLSIGMAIIFRNRLPTI